ncbi:MAG: glucose-1-phosphate adenylyltransferase [Polyangiales bacterium]
MQIHGEPNVLSMILAGGEGRRLHPLTADRAKPAVPFGGRYRIIDIVLSNFVNSGLTRIKVLTQYKSASLEEHIARSWKLSQVTDDWIEPMPAQQRTGGSWYKGSADAVFQCRNVIDDASPDLVAIFGGDHVYKMDVRQMIDFHLALDADVTIAAIPVTKAEAKDFGVLEVDAEGRVVAFHEKVADPPEIPGKPGKCLASLGNYVFNRQSLVEEIARDAAMSDEESKHDFGRDILPAMVKTGRQVFCYDFFDNRVPGEGERERGYWRDVGTLDAYWEAQMDLVSVQPYFNFYNRRWPIRTGMSHDPPAKFVFREEGGRVGTATDSLVANGCIISGGQIHRSVLSPQVRVNSFSEINESILFEAVNVGRHAKLKKCIVDKGADVPPGVSIGFDKEADKARGFVVSEKGVTVIPKGWRAQK